MLNTFVCQVPGCGVASTVTLNTNCLVWLDKTDHGSPVFMEVCPEHKAKFLRLVSDFASGSCS
jgi:hypothetical protein